MDGMRAQKVVEAVPLGITLSQKKNIWNYTNGW